MRTISAATMQYGIALLLAGNCCSAKATEPVRVTVDNFARAESDTYFAKFVDEAGIGKFKHERELAAIDDQTVIRLNRDTLYSFGVFDLNAGPVSVTLPDAGRRYMSVMVLDEDHYVHEVVYAPDSRTFTKEEIGTRYLCLAVRTFVNPNDAEDIKAVHALQDGIKIQQAAVGEFRPPMWDEASLKSVRDALLAVVTANGEMDSARMFGRKADVDPVQHLLGTAAGWGGNPASAAVYLGVVPKENDGKTAYQLTLKDVPVDGFWSISVYNKEGYFEKNERNAYTINNLTAKPDADGSVTIRFGGNEDEVNSLPITPGWNYLLRLYRPRPEVLNGSWKAPEAQPIQK